MDNKPFYDKYQVTRIDGEPVGRTLTIEIDKDPQAKQLLMAIADIMGSTRPEFAKSLRDLYDEPLFRPWPKIPRFNRTITVTEKIDGTNAQILVMEDGRVYAGSRNRWITPEDDNFGFAKWVEENKEALATLLGPGRHFGEWMGKGIQSGYGLDERRLYLFNQKYADTDFGDLPVYTVPVLYQGTFDQEAINYVVDLLRDLGSKAVPGFMKAEGVIVYHEAGNTSFKILLEGDEVHKGQGA